MSRASTTNQQVARRIDRTAVPGLSKKLPVFYGWIIVAVATMAIFFSGPGQTYSVSIFIDPIIREFGWSRSLISSLYAMGTLTAGLTMTFVGRLVDRVGHRLMLTAAATCLALACLFMSGVQTPLMVFAGFLGLRIFGQGSMTLIPNSLVPQWFIKRRGRAMSFTALGAMIGSAVIPFINLRMIEAVGWRGTWRLWTILLIVLMAPVAYLMVRNRPEEVGLLPDNESASSAAGLESRRERSFSLRRARRTRVFWITLLAGAVPSLVITGLTFHHMSILVSNGLTKEVAASVFTIAAVFSFPATLVAGAVCDRWPIKNVFGAALLGHACVLLFYLWTTSPLTAVVLGLLRGADQGFLMIIGGTIWPHYFGRTHLAGIRGVVTTAMVIGSALGPLFFGISYDLFGGYSQVILAMTLLPVTAAVAVFMSKAPRAARTMRA